MDKNHGEINLDVDNKELKKNLEDSAMDFDEYITIKIKNFHKKDEHKYNDFENLAKIKQQEVDKEWIRLEKLGHTCLQELQTYPSQIRWCEQEPCKYIKEENESNESKQKIKNIVYGSACSIL